jgi:hypothetical protein
VDCSGFCNVTALQCNPDHVTVAVKEQLDDIRLFRSRDWKAVKEKRKTVTDKDKMGY